MKYYINEFLSEMGLEYAVGLPMTVVIVILALALVAWGLMYFFNTRTRIFFNKHGVKYEMVEPVVRMLTMLAVRLFVMKASIEDTKKVNQFRIIASTIDNMYDTQSTLRLSELVMALENEIGRQHPPVLKDPQSIQLLSEFAAEERSVLVNEMSDSIIREINQVGRKVYDNENDPIVEPREISRWINKTLNSSKRVKKVQYLQGKKKIKRNSQL